MTVGCPNAAKCCRLEVIVRRQPALPGDAEGRRRFAVDVAAHGEPIGENDERVRLRFPAEQLKSRNATVADRPVIVPALSAGKTLNVAVLLPAVAVAVITDPSVDTAPFELGGAGIGDDRSLALAPASVVAAEAAVGTPTAPVAISTAARAGNTRSRNCLAFTDTVNLRKALSRHPMSS